MVYHHNDVWTGFMNGIEGMDIVYTLRLRPQAYHKQLFMSSIPFMNPQFNFPGPNGILCSQSTNNGKRDPYVSLLLRQLTPKLQWKNSSISFCMINEYLLHDALLQTVGCDFLLPDSTISWHSFLSNSKSISLYLSPSFDK